MKREKAEGVQEESTPCLALAKRDDTRPSGFAKGSERPFYEPLPLAFAVSGMRKARGLLFKRPREGALLLMPCGDVHTVGMRHRLDIAFVDAAGVVLESYRSVGPFRRLRRKGAVAVVERFSSCESSWFSAGDRVGVVRVEGGRP